MGRPAVLSVDPLSRYRAAREVALPIENDAQLADAVLTAGRLIQEISDYVKKNPASEATAKLRFPTGFLRTARFHRNQLQFVANANLRKNLSYACMTHDVFRWLIVRTDISGQARDMVIKEAICLTGSVCETLTIWPGEQGLGKSKSFANRVARLRELGVISEAVETDLNWVWDIRCREHIADVEIQEWNHYTTAQWRRSVSALRALRGGLSAWRGH